MNRNCCSRKGDIDDGNAPIVNGDGLFSAPEGRNPPGEGWRVTMHNNLVLDVNRVVRVVCSK
jgi:hypothetical protein